MVPFRTNNQRERHAETEDDGQDEAAPFYSGESVDLFGWEGDEVLIARMKNRDGG